MFLEYYGLREQPFGMTPDPRFLWSSASHREAFASLVYGIETGRGFVALIAKPGMGKTTLLFQLLDKMRGSARTAFLFQTQASSRELFSNLAADLGLDPAEQDLSKLQRQLNDTFVRESQVGGRIILVIDEAQDLADSVLESVRMLSNFETTKAKLIQIVLSGQPQLADKLMRPELAQLRQRVSVITHLVPFTEGDAAGYIEHRLRAAGYSGGPLFSPESLRIIADRSDGIPRNINNICFHALSVGCAKRQKQIDRSVMEEVLFDLNLGKLRSSRPVRQVQTPSARVPHLPRRSPAKMADYALRAVNYPLQRARQAISPAHHESSGHLSGRVFWVAGVITLLIWAGVFWSSVSASLPSGWAEDSVVDMVRRAGETARNLQAAFANSSHPPSQPAPATPEPPSNVPVTENHDSRAASEPGQPQSEPTTASEGTINQGVAGAGQDKRIRDDSGNSALLSSVMPSKTEHTQVRSPLPVRPLGTDSGQGVGKLVIESDVSGGRITVNGRNDRDWTTPHILSLPAGTYRISVAKGGYSTWSQLVRVAEGGEKWVMARLSLPRGMFILETDPPGMEVFIDGRSYGPSIIRTTLVPGFHTYKVLPPAGFAPFTGTFEIDAGRVLMRKVQWDRSSRVGEREELPIVDGPNSSAGGEGS